MRLLACLIVAPQRGYDEPAILSYAISSFCPTSADGLHDTQSAHERREVCRERGRNNVGPRGPQLARKRQREPHSIEPYLGRTAHRDRFSDKEPSPRGLASC